MLLLFHMSASQTYCSYDSNNLTTVEICFKLSFRSPNPLPADGFEEMLLSRPSHTHSLQQRPGSRTSWGLGHFSVGLCRSSLHMGTQVTPPPRQWQSWAQECWNTCPSSSLRPFISQPSSFRPEGSKGRGERRECYAGESAKLHHL